MRVVSLCRYFVRYVYRYFVSSPFTPGRSLCFARCISLVRNFVIPLFVWLRYVCLDVVISLVMYLCMSVVMYLFLSFCRYVFLSVVLSVFRSFFLYVFRYVARYCFSSLCVASVRYVWYLVRCVCIWLVRSFVRSFFAMCCVISFVMSLYVSIFR